MIASVHRPETDSYPGVAVIEPYGYNGNPINSGPRLDMAAKLAQVTIIGLQRDGTRTMVIDLGLRKALHPTRYDQTMADRVEELGETILRLDNECDTMAGHGAWGGGAPIAALAKLGMFERGVLFRNAINLHARHRRQRTLPGIIKFVRYEISGERDKPDPPDSVPRIPDAGERLPKLQKAMELGVEMFHYYPLILSSYMADAVAQLADYPRLPLSCVFFRHTPMGSLEQATEYMHDLLSIRAAAITRLRQISPDSVAARFSGHLGLTYYHSDLVSRPDLAAEHIRTMLDLGQSL